MLKTLKRYDDRKDVSNGDEEAQILKLCSSGLKHEVHDICEYKQVLKTRKDLEKISFSDTLRK